MVTILLWCAADFA